MQDERLNAYAQFLPTRGGLVGVLLNGALCIVDRVRLASVCKATSVLGLTEDQYISELHSRFIFSIPLRSAWQACRLGSLNFIIAVVHDEQRDHMGFECNTNHWFVNYSATQWFVSHLPPSLSCDDCNDRQCQ